MTAMTVATTGPDWATITTALGTVAVAIVAVSVALYADWQADRRVRAERAHSDKVIAEERALAEKRLAEQLAHSEAQLRNERQHAQEREQLAEAYAVQVVAARTSPKTVFANFEVAPENPVECPMAVVVNHGHYAITEVEAKFSNGQAIYPIWEMRHLSSFTKLPPDLAVAPSGPWDIHSGGPVLTPQDPGMRFTGTRMALGELIGVYPILRWTDWRGIRWEHRKGVVSQVDEDAAWAP
jgi:hypothetical protein